MFAFLSQCTFASFIQAAEKFDLVDLSKVRRGPTRRRCVKLRWEKRRRRRRKSHAAA